MFLRDPKILILEDITSKLDEQGRAAAEKAIDTAMQGRTVLVMSHQESLLEKCDSVCVIGDSGAIVEQGPFSVLSANPDSCYTRFRRGH